MRTSHLRTDSSKVMQGVSASWTSKKDGGSRNDSHTLRPVFEGVARIRAQNVLPLGTGTSGVGSLSENEAIFRQVREAFAYASSIFATATIAL